MKKRLQVPEDLVALVPLVLVLRLGAVSVAVGAAACAANLAIMRSVLGARARYTLVIVLSAAALLLWYVLLTYVLR